MGGASDEPRTGGVLGDVTHEVAVSSPQVNIGCMEVPVETRTDHPRTQRADVAVIGGGLAGLAAGAHAARAGADVVVAERSPELGGRARSQASGGYTFNFGPHALYRGGAAWAGLDELGVAVDGGVPGGDVAEWHGGLVTLPQSPAGLLRASWLGVQGRLQVARVLAALARSPAAELDQVSWGDHVRARASDPRARALLEALARISTYAADRRIAARAVLTNLRATTIHGVVYLHGGWQTLVDGVADAARDAGVRIVVGTGRINLDRTGDGWRVRGGRLDMDAAAVVVAAGPPRRTSEVLSDVVEPATLAAIEGRTPVRAAILDVALRRLPRPDRPFTLGIDEPTYLAVHSAWADLAPHGGAVVHLARYLDTGEQADVETREELEALLDRVQPGWRDEVVDARFLPDMTVVGDLAAAAAGGMAGRQPVTVEPGLHLAGDWVGGEGVLADAVFASARAAGIGAAAHATRRAAVTA